MSKDHITQSVKLYLETIFSSASVETRRWTSSTALPLLTSLREVIEPSFVVVLYTLIDGRAPDNSVFSHGFPAVR